jgi:hypothetical protein
MSGNPYSRYGGGGSGGSSYSRKDRDDDGGGLFDWLTEPAKALPGNLNDLAQGLGGIVSSIGHDVAAAGTRALPGVDDWDFKLDDITKAFTFDWEGMEPEEGADILSDLAHFKLNEVLSNPRVLPTTKADIKRRYASPEAIGEGLKEEPLFYLLDLLDVATLGGSAAVRGASTIGKAGRVAGQLSDVARGTRGAGDVSRTARAVDKVVPGLKRQLIGEAVPLGGERTMVNQLAPGYIETKALPDNPLRRIFATNPRDALRSTRPETIRAELSQIDEAVAAGNKSTDLVTKQARLRATLNEAERGAQILGRRASTKQLKTLTDKMTGITTSRTYAERGRLWQRHHEINQTLTKGEAEDLFEKTQGLQPVPNPHGALSFDEVPQALRDPEIAPHPLATEIERTLPRYLDHERQMSPFLDDTTGLTARTELEKRVTNDFLDDLKASGRSFQPGVARVEQLTPDEAVGLQARITDEVTLERDATRNLIEMFAGEPLAGLRTGAELDKTSAAINQHRLINFQEEASQFLDNGGSARALFERVYLPLRVKEWHTQGLNSIDEATSAWDLHAAVRDAGLKAPAYFPHVVMPKMSDLLSKLRPRGMGKASEPDFFKKNRAVALKRHLEGVKNAVVTNPDEAYMHLAASIARQEETLRFIQKLKNSGMGRKVAVGEDIEPGVEELINPDAVRMMLFKSFGMKNEAAKAIMDGVDPGDAFISSVKKLLSDPDADARQLLATRGELFAVPKVVGGRMRELVKWSVGGNTTRLTFDAYMNVWRNSTLYLRAPFYVNQIFGNSVLLWLGRGRLSHVIRQLEPKYRKTVDNVIKELDVDNVVASGFNVGVVQRTPHLGAAAETPVGKAYTAIQGSKAYRGPHKVIEGGQKFISALEDSFRKEAFMNAGERDLAKRGVISVHRGLLRSKQRMNAILKHGLDNPRAAERWADETNVVMNNYFQQPPFVKKVVRRFAAPFWPFFFHAAKTLVTMPFVHPLKSQLIHQLSEANKDFEQEALAAFANVADPLLPEFLEGATAVGPGDEPGDVDFLTSGGLNPFANIMDESKLDILNPLAKVVYERATGESSFDQQPFSSPGHFQPFGSDETYSKETGQPETPLPNLFEHLIGQFPLHRQAKNLLPGAGARYDTGETIENPDGTPKYPVDQIQELMKMLGVPLTTYPVREYTERERANRRAARDAFGER